MASVVWKILALSDMLFVYVQGESQAFSKKFWSNLKLWYFEAVYNFILDTQKYFRIM